LEQFQFKKLSDHEIRHSMVLATTERLALNAGKPDDLELGGRMAEVWFEIADQLALVETHAYDGIHGLVQKLHQLGLRQAVLSNNSGILVRKILANRNLIEYFPIVFGEEDVPEPKPDARGLQSILRAWQFEPDEVLFVGDSASDIGTAERAGCQTLGVTWGAHTRKELEPMMWDTLVDTIDEALEAILRLVES
jgi:phosphoglycolate phosphatase